LSPKAALQTAGSLPENVNYAVKSTYLGALLESMPGLADKVKVAHRKKLEFEDLVKTAEQATVLVLVY
jgi:hypothetical protein